MNEYVLDASAILALLNQTAITTDKTWSNLKIGILIEVIR
jgi:PIN domain nuclease of toxin-antitoxin system